jgi:hypothetical protein
VCRDIHEAATERPVMDAGQPVVQEVVSGPVDTTKSMLMSSATFPIWIYTPKLNCRFQIYEAVVKKKNARI